MEEIDRARVTPVFAADTHLHSGSHPAPRFYRNANEPPDTLFVQVIERILGEDTAP